MARHKLHPGLVALSASAIAAIYGVGYVHTQPVDASLTAPTPAASVTTVVSTSPTTSPARSTPLPPGAVVPQSAVVPPATATTPPTVGPTTPPAAATAAYRDGSFTGTGRSRFGDVTVQVTVQGGKILGVSLTRVTTKYPASRISALPAQVVSRQSAQVDNVSGATASASAFRGAVQAALAAAKA